MTELESSSYSEKEIQNLHAICQKHTVPPELVEKLIEAEQRYHEMGKRRGFWNEVRQCLEEYVES